MVAFAVVTGGILAGLLFFLRADAIYSGGKVLSAFAQLTSEQTTRTVQSVDEALQEAAAVLSAATEAGTADAPRIRLAFRKIREGRPFLRAIIVLSDRGRTVYGSEDRPLDQDLSDREYFLRFKNDPAAGFALGVPIVTRSTQEWVLPAARTWRRPNGDFAGVIIGAIDVPFLNRVWTVDDDIQGLAVSLWRDDGMLLMRTPFDSRVVATRISGILLARMRAGDPRGTFQTASLIDGKRRLVVYRRLDAYPTLYLSFTQSMDEVLAVWWRIFWIIACSWVLGTAALGGLVLWLARLWDTHCIMEVRYRALFKASPHPMFALDAKSRRFLAVSDSTVERYGWSRDELLAMKSDDIYPPEDLAKVKALRLEPPLDSTAPIKGLRHRKKDGTIIDVELIVRPMDLGGRPAYLTTTEDVTGQLRSEMARFAAEEQLRQAQKMEAVGQLTGGIAHDFNNILFVILANTDELLEEESLGAEVKDRLDQIDKAVQRATGLTRQLLAFSRKQPLRPQQSDLNDLVAETSKLLHRALGAQIEMESILADDLCVVDIDRSQLETALVNICINARDAMPGGGRLLIETQNVTLDGDYVARNPDATAGDYAMLSVTDCGEGMSPETLARVFEPFFTTKDVGKGSGLGLSMVYGFIKQSKGHVGVYSEVGHGTSIKLFLPCCGTLAEEVVPRDVSAVLRGTERILVVEDEPQVRASVVLQLRSLGYTVSEAPDGAAGVVAFETAPLPYDLLLTDVVMPGPLNGKGLADVVARRWPGTKIVFMSGFTEISSVRHGRLDEGSVLLSKPFRKRDMALIVRGALDGAGSEELLARPT